MAIRMSVRLTEDLWTVMDRGMNSSAVTMARGLGEQTPICGWVFLSSRLAEELWIALDGFREVRLYPFLN